MRSFNYDDTDEKQVYLSFLQFRRKNLEKYWTMFFVSLCSHHFKRSLDIKATKISVLSGISRMTLNKLFKQIRILIAKECENISKLQGEMQIDESYFLFHNCKQKELKE